MTGEQMRDLVKECGLDWHRGFVPLFEGDTTNRYATLIDAVQTTEREACAKVCDELVESHKRNTKGECDESCEVVAAFEVCADSIRERSNV